MLIVRIVQLFRSQQEEKVMMIPRKLMMTLTTAKEGPLGVCVWACVSVEVM